MDSVLSQIPSFPIYIIYLFYHRDERFTPSLAYIHHVGSFLLLFRLITILQRQFKMRFYKRDEFLNIPYQILSTTSSVVILEFTE